MTLGEYIAKLQRYEHPEWEIVTTYDGMDAGMPMPRQTRRDWDGVEGSYIIEVG